MLHSVLTCQGVASARNREDSARAWILGRRRIDAEPAGPLAESKPLARRERQEHRVRDGFDLGELTELAAARDPHDRRCQRGDGRGLRPAVEHRGLAEERSGPQLSATAARNTDLRLARDDQEEPTRPVTFPDEDRTRGS